MPTFKIINITNTLGKRDPKYNSIATIDYVDRMQKKKMMINPGETSYLTITQLPVSVQKMMVIGNLSVQEISGTELKDIMKPKIVVQTAIIKSEEPPQPIKKRIKTENPPTE